MSNTGKKTTTVCTVTKTVRARRPITHDEELTMLRLLLEGRSPYTIAKILERDRGSVVRVAGKHRKELSDEVQKRLNFKDRDDLDALSRYLKSENRQALLSEMLDVAKRKMSDPMIPAKDLRELAVVVGICVDKFVVETGKNDDGAKASLVAMFARMETTETTEVTNGTTDPDRETTQIHLDETKEIKSPVR